MESQKKFPVTYSFELFPPQTPEGIEKLRVTRGRLAQYHPKFFQLLSEPEARLASVRWKQCWR